MQSQSLKDFSKLWTNTCHTMWVEILSLRGLEANLKGNYANIPKTYDLTDIIYAPECRGRMQGINKDVFLDDIETYIQYNITTVRVVLLSAAFEAYFLSFLEEYIQNRPKHFASGSRTALGNQIFGQIKSTRGITERIKKFAELTNSKIANIESRLPVLGEVYQLRNIIAHRAGICKSEDLNNLLIITPNAGERISISPEILITRLAPPCVEIAQLLDRKINPESLLIKDKK
jgi:hypothetical protein